MRAAGTSAASISRTPRLPSRRKRRILMGCETNDTVDRGEQGARTRSCGTKLDWLTAIRTTPVCQHQDRSSGSAYPPRFRPPKKTAPSARTPTAPPESEERIRYFWNFRCASWILFGLICVDTRAISSRFEIHPGGFSILTALISGLWCGLEGTTHGVRGVRGHVGHRSSKGTGAQICLRAGQARRSCG